MTPDWTVFFGGEDTNVTTTGRGFSGGPVNDTAGFFGGSSNDTFLYFFFHLSKDGRTKAQVCSLESEEFFQVERKWSFLPITPTYDQYVWVTILESEGFHVLTRSGTKECSKPPSGTFSTTSGNV